MTLQLSRPRFSPAGGSLSGSIVGLATGHIAAAGGPKAGVYLAGKFSAQMGQNALLAALLITAGTSDSASTGLSAFFLAMLIPSVLLGALGGAFVDRLGAGPAFAAGAALRGAAVLPAFFLLDTPYLVGIVAGLYSAASQLFTPAEFALVPKVQGSHPGRMYSSLTAAQYAGQGAGLFVFGPALYFLGGQAAVFIGVIGVFAFVSLLGGALIQMGVERGRRAEPAQHAFSFRGVTRFLFSDGRAFYAVVALTLAGIIARALVVALPPYVRSEIAIGPLGLLFVVVPGCIGIVAGMIWTSRKLSLERSAWMLRVSSLSALTGLFLLAFVDHGFTLAMQSTAIPAVQDFESWMNTTAAIVIPASFLGGFGLCVIVMSARFVLTELAPPGAQGRVHAVQLVVTEAVLVVPVLLAGVAASFAGARLTLAIVGAVALGTLAATEWRHAARRLAEARPVLAPDVHGPGFVKAD